MSPASWGVFRAMGKELSRVVTLEEGARLVAQHWPQLGVEAVPLSQAWRRVLAAPALARDAVPGFDRSTVDGLAVRARDTFGASESLPAYLTLVGQVNMGEEPRFSLDPDQPAAAAVATGGMLPPGADAVVMVEYTERLEDGQVAVLKPVAPGENIIARGEDTVEGQVLLAAGHRVRPQDLGLLAAGGVTDLEVYAPPRVGIISTGDELVTPDRSPGPGQVRELNSYMLSGLVQAAGGLPRGYGIIGDSREALARTVYQASLENDLVLLSGGSSVGTRDWTYPVLDELTQGGILFEGLAIHPGKPTIAASPRERRAGEASLLIGLPGHPVSALVVFKLLVAPLLLHGDYQRAEQAAQRREVRARLAASIASAAGREDYVGVKLDLGKNPAQPARAGSPETEPAELWAYPVWGKSGLISTMVAADGLIRIPAVAEGLAAGEVVAVRVWDAD